MCSPKVNRFYLSEEFPDGEYVDISIRREDCKTSGHIPTKYALEITPSLDIPTSTFEGGTKIIYLQATFNDKSKEIKIDNIEANGLRRNQAFSLTVYSRLLELTPDCNSIYLYNIINQKVENIIKSAATNPDWELPKESILISGLYNCGFQKVVGVKEGCYLGARAINLKRLK